MVKKTMQAVLLPGPGGKLKVEEVPVPVPGPGEVLVKIRAAPVNPSDLTMVGGTFLSPSYPFIPGLEGCGDVVAAGSGLLPKIRKGRLVACASPPGGNGTWAEYVVTGAARCVPLPKGLSPQEGSMMLINPMTAMAFIDLAQKEGHHALVNNAASSALGMMLIRLAAHYRIPLINVVRKEEDMIRLREAGAGYTLNSETAGFGEELKELAAQLRATLILDAVSGPAAHILLQAAPEGSTLMEYARLSGVPLQADPADLISGRKQIRGFLLSHWLESKGILYRIRFLGRVRRHMPSLLISHIRETFPLEKVGSALSLYKEQMSAGKVLLVPGGESQPER